MMLKKLHHSGLGLALTCACLNDAPKSVDRSLAVHELSSLEAARRVGKWKGTRNMSTKSLETVSQRPSSVWLCGEMEDGQTKMRSNVLMKATSASRDAQWEHKHFRSNVAQDLAVRELVHRIDGRSKR